MREAQVEILQIFANGLVSNEQAERMMDALEEPQRLPRRVDADGVQPDPAPVRSQVA